MNVLRSGEDFSRKALSPPIRTSGLGLIRKYPPHLDSNPGAANLGDDIRVDLAGPEPTICWNAAKRPEEPYKPDFLLLL